MANASTKKAGMLFPFFWISGSHRTHPSIGECHYLSNQIAGFYRQDSILTVADLAQARSLLYFTLI